MENEQNEGIKGYEQHEEYPSVIKIIGVGGGGGNAANFMYSQNIAGVDFVICNTDRQALDRSPIPNKIQLGEKGLGAGSRPEIGAQVAIESLPTIQEMLSDSTEMVFITAGMGGGTGTGAAPVIAKAAKDMGILTVGIVTIPFAWEGSKRVRNALVGLEEMRKNVDAIIIITNERIRKLYSDLTVKNAFAKADKILSIAASGIAELITRDGDINVDLEDVRTVMTNSGDAIMGAGLAAGPNRAVEAVQDALNSPLLISTDIRSAKNILLNVTYGDEMTMDEFSTIVDFLTVEYGFSGENLIYGLGQDPSLGEHITVTVVAAGMDLSDVFGSEKQAEPKVAAQPSHTTTSFLDFFGNKKSEPEQQPVVEKPDSGKLDALHKSLYGSGNAGSVAQTRPVNVIQTQTQAQPQTQEPPKSNTIDLDDDETLGAFMGTPAFERANKSKAAAPEIASVFSINSDKENPISDKNAYLHKNVD